MTIKLTPKNDGFTLPVHALPGSRRNHILGEHDGRLKIAVTQVAEKGKANKAIIKLLTKELGISQAQISLNSGVTNPKKTFLITGLSEEELKQKLSGFLP